MLQAAHHVTSTMHHLQQHLATCILPCVSSSLAEASAVNHGLALLMRAVEDSVLGGMQAAVKTFIIQVHGHSSPPLSLVIHPTYTPHTPSHPSYTPHPVTPCHPLSPLSHPLSPLSHPLSPPPLTPFHLSHPSHPSHPSHLSPPHTPHTAQTNIPFPPPPPHTYLFSCTILYRARSVYT